MKEAVVALFLSLSLTLGGHAHGGHTAPRPAARAQGQREASKRDRPKREEAGGDRARHDKTASGNRGGKGRDDVPPSGPHDPDKARVERLQDALRAELGASPLGRLKVGLHVSDAHSGRLFYRRHADTLMDPASNQKILATSAAVLRLGADWHFTTTLRGNLPDAEGVVAGPIYLRGDGDPTLRTADLEELASRLVARGVTRIEGAVLADPRHGAETKDGQELERAPLLVNHSLVFVRVRPSEVGQPPLLAIEPETTTWQIENEAKTVAKGRSRVTVTVSSRFQDGVGRLVVHVSGRISEESAGAVFRRRVSHPALYGAAVMRGALLRAGIAVSGDAGVGNEPAEAHTLSSHASPPLSTLLRRVNKDSDNDQAERVLDAVGATIAEGPPSLPGNLAALRAALADLGVAPASYVSRNGSGLGHENRLTADMMASLFRALHTDPRLGPEIEQSLSVGGVDGTTRNRFKGTAESHRVRAKTGTLNGKSALSGLVGDDGDVLAFSILVQGLRHRSLTAVRQAQVRAVSAMMRYLRASAASELPEGSGVPDFETGEEPSEMESETHEEAPPLPGAPPGAAPPAGAPALSPAPAPKAGTTPAPVTPPSQGVPASPPPQSRSGATSSGSPALGASDRRASSFVPASSRGGTKRSTTPGGANARPAVAPPPFVPAPTPRAKAP